MVGGSLPTRLDVQASRAKTAVNAGLDLSPEKMLNHDVKWKVGKAGMRRS